MPTSCKSADLTIRESGLKFGLDCWETTSHTGAQEEACWKEFRIPRGPTKPGLRRIRISIISCILGPWNTENKFYPKLTLVVKCRKTASLCRVFDFL